MTNATEFVYAIREGFEKGKGRYLCDLEGSSPHLRPVWSPLAKDALVVSFPYRNGALSYASEFGGRVVRFKIKAGTHTRLGP